MISTEPQIADKDVFNVTDTAKILRIARSTLLNCIADENKSQKVAIVCGINKRTNYKFFTGASIKKFWRSQY